MVFYKTFFKRLFNTIDDCVKKRFFKKLEVGGLSLLFFFVTCSSLLLAENGDAARIAKITAAHVYHITKFTKWPSNAFENEDSPFVFCTVAAKLVNDVISQIVKVKGANGRNFSVKSYDASVSEQDLKKCNLAYFGSSIDKNRAKFIKYLSGNPTLTISGPNDEIGKTIIQFVESENKLRVKVLIKELNKTGLTISAELLSISIIVENDV